MKPMEKEARELWRLMPAGASDLESVRLALVAARNAKGEECIKRMEQSVAPTVDERRMFGDVAFGKGIAVVSAAAAIRSMKEE